MKHYVLARGVAVQLAASKHRRCVQTWKLPFSPHLFSSPYIYVWGLLPCSPLPAPEPLADSNIATPQWFVDTYSQRNSDFGEVRTRLRRTWRKARSVTLVIDYSTLRACAARQRDIDWTAGIFFQEKCLSP